ncbi:MAG: FAD-binding oxidoreductase [Pseudomonadota bacterium]|nr:FAD-binding oxidoreductase [Pseudomonadota bacterium]
MPLNDDLIEKLVSAAGEDGVLTGNTDRAPYEAEERGLIESRCDAVVRPTSTEAVAKVVRLCAAAGIPMIAMGGNTGLVGGGVANGGVIISTERLNKIIAVDALNHTMTVEAGCILADTQRAAEEKDCLFPLSLGAEGSCHIGGNLATNAGGIGVLRYGNTRDLVLGLEVVLADGRVWSGLNALRKDNTGYDLKHLFIGAEGTLGIITKAVVKLYPLPRTKVTAMAALDSLDNILALFDRVRAACGDRLTAFEMIAEIGLELVIRHIPDTTDPFTGHHPWYVLLELTSSRTDDDLRVDLEAALGAALEAGEIADAVFAESGAQAAALWKLREEIPAAQTREGGSIKHDVSVPVASACLFIARASQAVEAEMAGIRVCAFGHVGDGNIHFNLTQPIGYDKQDFIGRWGDFNMIVHDIVMEMGGSISAEHGIGLVKRDDLSHYGNAVELEMMRTIKRALDPKNLMNPGKIFRLEEPSN